MSDQDHLEDDRKEFEARGLVTRIRKLLANRVTRCCREPVLRVEEGADCSEDGAAHADRRS